MTSNTSDWPQRIELSDDGTLLTVRVAPEDLSASIVITSMTTVVTRETLRKVVEVLHAAVAELDHVARRRADVAAAAAAFVVQCGGLEPAKVALSSYQPIDLQRSEFQITQ